MQAINDICYLLTEGKTIKNENGFKVKTEPVREEVYCGVKSATRTEFYNAMKDGIRIAYVFMMIIPVRDRSSTMGSCTG